MEEESGEKGSINLLFLVGTFLTGVGIAVLLAAASIAGFRVLVPT